MKSAREAWEEFYKSPQRVRLWCYSDERSPVVLAHERAAFEAGYLQAWHNMRDEFDDLNPSPLLKKETK